MSPALCFGWLAPVRDRAVVVRGPVVGCWVNNLSHPTAARSRDLLRRVRVRLAGCWG